MNIVPSPNIAQMATIAVTTIPDAGNVQNTDYLVNSNSLNCCLNLRFQ